MELDFRKLVSLLRRLDIAASHIAIRRLVSASRIPGGYMASLGSFQETLDLGLVPVVLSLPKETKIGKLRYGHYYQADLLVTIAALLVREDNFIRLNETMTLASAIMLRTKTTHELASTLHLFNCVTGEEAIKDFVKFGVDPSTFDDVRLSKKDWVRFARSVIDHVKNQPVEIRVFRRPFDRRKRVGGAA